MQRFSAPWTTAALAWFVGMSGCESKPAELCPVRGKVLYRAVPVRNGSVVFTPDVSRGNTGRQASAETQADGSYVLRTGDTPGAVAGWYRVTIMALEAPVAASGRSFGAARSLLPEKYRDPDLSGLSREVKAGQENIFDFNLD